MKKSLILLFLALLLLFVFVQTSPAVQEQPPSQNFEPSEKLPADQAISFPVDI